MEVELLAFLISALDAPAAFPREQSPGYPLDKWVGGAQSRSGHADRYAKKENLCSCWQSKPDSSVVQPVAYYV